MFRENPRNLRCLAATILPPGTDKDQWVDQVSMRMKRMQFTNLCNAGCLQQRSRGLFKSGHGALSAKCCRPHAAAMRVATCCLNE